MECENGSPCGDPERDNPYTGAVNVKGEACDTCDFSIFPTDVFLEMFPTDSFFWNVDATDVNYNYILYIII